MAWAWVAAGTAAAGSIYASSSANAAAAQSQEALNERYGLKASISKQQMLENQLITRGKLTDATVKFMNARGKMENIMAGSGAAGNVQKRLKADMRSKASKMKSDIVKESETNAVNIAHDAIADNLDWQAQWAKYESQKKSTFEIALSAFSSGLSGYNTGTEFNKNIS